MGVVEIQCPVCDARVARCDNAVLLDVPAVEWSDDPAGACWTVMRLGPTSLASVGGPGVDGRGHTLHEHQPEEETRTDEPPMHGTQAPERER